jgi:DNA-binding NtrC family response regulator
MNAAAAMNRFAVTLATAFAGAVALLAETLAQHDHPDTGNLFLAEAAVEALKNGAFDFVTKPVDLDELERIIKDKIGE